MKKTKMWVRPPDAHVCDEPLPELKDCVDVVTVVKVDEGEVHETLLPDDGSESQVFVVVGEMIFGPV